METDESVKILTPEGHIFEKKVAQILKNQIAIPVAAF